MKNLTYYLTAALLLGLAGNHASANIVANGDFEAPANLQGNGNIEGYTGIPDFTGNNGGIGLNGSAVNVANFNGTDTTSADDTITLTPFDPSGYGAAGDPSVFSFVEFDSSTLTQNITLEPNTDYSLSFDYAPRSGSVVTGAVVVDVTGTVLGVPDVTTPVVDDLLTPVTGSDFVSSGTISFSTLGITDITSASIIRENTTEGDNTIDFANVDLEVAPEPSIYALLGLGAFALIAIQRVRSRLSF